MQYAVDDGTAVCLCYTLQVLPINALQILGRRSRYGLNALRSGTSHDKTVKLLAVYFVAKPWQTPAALFLLCGF